MVEFARTFLGGKAQNSALHHATARVRSHNLRRHLRLLLTAKTRVYSIR